MPTDLLATPPVAFLISLLIVFAIYFLGRSKRSPSPDKDATYSCGEKGFAEEAPVSIHIFEYAAIFLVFDVIAILLIFALDAAFPILPLIYVALAAVALLTLPAMRGRE